MFRKFSEAAVSDSAITYRERRRDNGMNWTDERVEKLKRLWSEGLSASQIAAQLGGVSRNAVIGKAHRLGLKSRPSPVKANEPEKKAAAKK